MKVKTHPKHMMRTWTPKLPSSYTTHFKSHHPDPSQLAQPTLTQDFIQEENVLTSDKLTLAAQKMGESKKKSTNTVH